jgi:putative signal transducing protein
MENPVRLFSSNQILEVEFLKTKLEEQNIGSHMINKQDSAYVMIGEVELYVDASNLERAQEIMKEIE